MKGTRVKFAIKLIAIMVVAAAVLATGYWWGNSRSSPSAVNSSLALSPQEETKGEPKRKILYYRNPMGHPDTSPVPKKDSMGMDYLPVYEGEEPSDASGVKISTEKIQKLGVKTEVAALRKLTRTVRAVATVQPDERRLHKVAPRFEGWIQRLYVNTTGQAVKKGDALMDVYSPELITAQHEYVVARKGMRAVAEGSPEVEAAMERLGESALQRLRNWDISDADLESLWQEGQPKHLVTLRAPVSGVVLEKSVTQGQRFAPGEVLYQIADLSKVWMLVDVFEQDLALVHRGQSATVRMVAYPDKIFNGEVTFIYPTVMPETRTAKVRIELPNNQGLLKPAMYGRVELASFLGKDKVLTVPESAVLDKGAQQLVLVALGEGRFEPRTIKLGMYADDYVEVLEGLTAGEAVVVSANFLIDAESNLKAALGGFSNHPAGSPEGNEQVKSGVSAAAAGSTSHRGKGSIEAMDWAQATITIAHGPIGSLNWPAMTMDFHARDPALLRALKPGQKVDFEIVEESAGEYVIVRIHPLVASPTPGERGGH